MGRKRPDNTWKPTEDELEARISLVVDMLARKFYKHQIKSALRELAKRQLPNTYRGPDERLDARTIEAYIARAKERLAAIGAQTAAEQFRATVAHLEAVLRDQKASIRERLEAQRDLAKMYGIDQPGRVLFNPNPEDPSAEDGEEKAETRPAVLTALEVAYGVGRAAVAN